MRLIPTEIAVNSLENWHLWICARGFIYAFVFSQDLVFGPYRVRFHQENDEQKDLIGSGICSGLVHSRVAS